LDLLMPIVAQWRQRRLLLRLLLRLRLPLQLGLRRRLCLLLLRRHLRLPPLHLLLPSLLLHLQLMLRLLLLPPLHLPPRMQRMAPLQQLPPPPLPTRPQAQPRRPVLALATHPQQRHGQQPRGRHE
jgi:hypothetical protein